MQTNYFVPDDENLMNQFYASIRQGDRIPYTIIGVGFGLLKSNEDIALLEFGGISEAQAKEIRQKALNIAASIKSYFRKVHKKSIEVKSSSNHLIVLSDEGVIDYSGMKMKRIRVRFRQWYRSLRDVDYRNVSKEKGEMCDRLIFENAETYRQFSEKPKNATFYPPEQMFRPLPIVKAKTARC